MKLESFDSLIAKAVRANENENSLYFTSEMRKKRCKVALTVKLQKAELAVDEAKEELERVIVTGKASSGGAAEIDIVALELQKIESSYNFYKELISQLFPEPSK